MSERASCFYIYGNGMRLINLILNIIYCYDIKFMKLGIQDKFMDNFSYAAFVIIVFCNIVC